MSAYNSNITSFSYDMNEVKEDPDYIYYNCDIINNGSQSSLTAVDEANPIIRFNETRDAPIINDCSKYNFSIIRFALNGSGKALPCFIPSIRIGPVNNPTSNINLTVYDVGLSVSVSYTVGVNTFTNTFNATAPVIYAPEIQDPAVAPLPSPLSTQVGQDLNTLYYWVMNVSHWVDLVNDAYQTAWNTLNTAFNAWYLLNFGLPGPNLTTQPPRLTFNPTTNLFNIWADRYGFGDNQIPIVPPATQNRTAPATADENFSMYMDANLYGMFSNFDSQYLNQPNSFTYKILITNIAKLFNNIYNVFSPPAPAVKSYWIMTQDHPSTSSLWSPIASIVFTSGTLPLVFETTGEPIRFGTGNVGTENSTQAAFQPIITDIQLTNDNAFNYRDFIQYAPDAEYRLASFQKSKVPISQIDIQVYYKNRLDAKLYPLRMYNLSSVSIKIMFRRRGIFDYPHPARIAPDKF